MIDIAICGHGRCGKDTVAMWLNGHTELIYHESTSQAAQHICFDELRYKYGYESAKQAFEDRHNHREEWAKIIWEYNQPDGLTLYRGMLETANILNGVRRASELQALKDANLLELTVWIERRVPIDPSCEITMSDCDIVIPNLGDLPTLYKKLETLAAALDID